MNIKSKEEFLAATPLERKFYLKYKGIPYRKLASKHRRTKASISYALDNKRKHLLQRIANSLFKETKIRINEQR